VDRSSNALAGALALLFDTNNAIIGEAVFLFLLIWWLREQGLTLTDLGVWTRRNFGPWPRR